MTGYRLNTDGEWEEVPDESEEAPEAPEVQKTPEERTGDESAE